MRHVAIFVFGLLASCVPYEEVPIENCSEDFRDRWWLVDPKTTDSMTPQLDNLCFNVHSSGTLEVINYYGDWHNLYKWECVNDPIEGDGEHINVDFYHILNQGSALLERTEAEDVWMMNISFKLGIFKEETLVWPCDEWGLE